MQTSIACSQPLVPVRTTTFLSLVTILFCCHLINALISEHLLAGAHIFKYSIFFTCFQCSGYILLALISRAFLRSQARCTPLRTYALIGILQAVTLASSVRFMLFEQSPLSSLLNSYPRLDSEHPLPELSDGCDIQKR